MFDALRNRSIGPLAGIAACCLLFTAPLAAQDTREAGRDTVPLLAEDRPVDFDEHAPGPWDGRWLLQSTEIDGEERLTYFCSDFVDGQCRGREIKAEPILLAGARLQGGTCAGSCEGQAKVSISMHLESCSTAESCPMDENHIACDAAAGRSLKFATANCQREGGQDCACFAQAKIQSFRSRCKSGTLDHYCRYRCIARSEGTCAKS